MSYDNPRRFRTSLFDSGIAHMVRGKAAYEAGKFDDALSSYKNALMAFNESRDRRAKIQRPKCEYAIEVLLSKLGAAAAAQPAPLAKTTPEAGPSDLEAFYDGIAGRRALEKELSEKKAGNDG